MHDILVRRRAERDALIELARGYVHRLSARLTVRAAYVAGSVARGDFNVWSDVDIVVVAEALPDRIPDRMTVLMIDAPPGVQAVGFTPEEFEAAVVKGNPLVVEALDLGVALVEPAPEGGPTQRP